ncbi:glycosyltransferase [Gephyromycinifex aptenodytis]|uniref:glycosyltransferase n=1 Tax=Gephyromycinifex aptenodytis TaxID=2716227 RepID=UPI0014462E33|nr:glycosyltransferase family 4 protein [Gephyromycinifex aptenodytis]
MSHSARAVIVSAVNPYPPDSGKAVVLAGFLRHLRTRLGASNVHYVHLGPAITDLEPFKGVQVHEVGTATGPEKLKAIALEAGLKRRSLQETFMASPSVAERVQTILTQIDADVEIIDTIRLLQHVGEPPARGRRVLYLDDLFSVRYRRMLRTIGEGGTSSSFDPLGQFAGNVPRPLRGLTRQPWSRNALLALESRRIARAENAAARHSSLSLLLNDEEAAGLRARTGADVRVIPPWVPQRPVAQYTWDGRPEYVFVGLLAMPHNHDGLVWFLQEGMPALLQARPDARLHVVGRDAPESMLAAAAPYGDHVVIHGYVDDLDEAVMTRAALVNPLRFGSGVKIKSLDALARGVPIVATPYGVEGIATSSEPGLIIVNDAAAAGRALAELADPVQREKHAAGARELYLTRFADDVVMEAYDSVFGTSA